MKFKQNLKYIKSRDEKILNSSMSKCVLHIGACDSPFTKEKYTKNLLLHSKLNSVTDAVLGVDIDKLAINEMRNLGFDNVMYFDMNDLSDLDYAPDIIVFGETIEHLGNLDNALENIKKIMGHKTELLISTPNAFYIENFKNALFLKENTHPDHVVNFSPQTLKQLLEKSDFEVNWIVGTFLNRESENFSKAIIRVFCRLFPMFSETLLTSVSIKKV